ncbi:MAG TPA: MXAN_6577-like cysteine-rich protein, partial [Gemmatimonadales bacterium]|nr:MXAN_6577-like cysteine-rich protein [Gemmatimonadales bacterium]
MLAAVAAVFVACASGNGPSFTGGDASTACDPGHPLTCQSGCVDPQTDGANCGGCGTVCAVGTTCKAGTCTCANGQASCGTACVNTQTDPMNCGKCSMACPMGQVCSNGACKGSCDMGLTMCGAMCIDTTKDPAHCGGCNSPCATVANATATCSASQCSYACNMGWQGPDGGVEGGMAEGGTPVVCNCHDTATPQNPDKPDLAFVDENCDGIDGTIADAIFVSTHGNNTNPGTMSQPVATITK